MADIFKSLETADAERMRTAMIDAIHGDLDGWDEEHDREVISQFVNEIAEQSQPEPVGSLTDTQRLDFVIAALVKSGIDFLSTREKIDTMSKIGKA